MLVKMVLHVVCRDCTPAIIEIVEEKNTLSEAAFWYLGHAWPMNAIVYVWVMASSRIMVFQVHKKCTEWIRFYYFDELNSAFFPLSLSLPLSPFGPFVDAACIPRKPKQLETANNMNTKWRKANRKKERKHNNNQKQAPVSTALQFLRSFQPCRAPHYLSLMKITKRSEKCVAKLGQTAERYVDVQREWIIHVNLCSRFDCHTTSWLPLQFYFALWESVCRCCGHARQHARRSTSATIAMHKLCRVHMHRL